MIQRATLLTISIFFLLANLYAQEEKSKSEDGLREGSLSLQFRVSENFTLAAFENTLFSFKKHSTDNKAWRFSVGIRSNISDSDTESSSRSADMLTGKMTTDRDILNVSVELGAQALRYLSTKKNVNAFWGLGPVFGVTRNKLADEIDTDTGNTSNNETISSNYAIGAGGSFGVEWFLNSNISLLGEYGANILFSYWRNKRESANLNTESVNETEETIKEIHLASSGVRFGISVYF